MSESVSGSTDPEAGGWKRTKAVVTLLALVPGALVTAVFFYYGWVYTSVLYAQFGISVAGLEFSTTDYIVRSLNVFVDPTQELILGVILLAAALVVAHWRVGGWWGKLQKESPRTAARVVVTIVMTGWVGMAVSSASDFAGLAAQPLAWLWLLSAALTFYGMWMAWTGLGVSRAKRRRVWLKDHWRARGATVEPDDEVWFTRYPRLTALGVLISVAAVLFGVFESTRLYAQTKAVRAAITIEANCFAFPMLELVAATDLGVEGQGVIRTPEENDDGVNLFRWSGLRLLLHDNGRLVIWPAAMSPRKGVMIIQESNVLTVQTRTELLSLPGARDYECPGISGNETSYS
jgi:hypothetical protein